MANVKEVEWQGGIYNIADETARGEAQQARSLANTAQSTAERAMTAAGNAQNTAGAAQDAAGAAQITADAAQAAVTVVSSNFDDYKELKTATVNFGSQGFVFFQKRGNICEISIVELDAQPGIYTVSIPAGFTPLRGTGVGALPLTWGEKSYGYWIAEGGNILIHVLETHSINATHVFLM